MNFGIEAGKHTHDVASRFGIRGVPINAEMLANTGIESTLAPLRERSLQPCQIGAFGFNPLSPDVAGQEKQQAILEQIIPLAAKTGCPYIVISGGNYHRSTFGGVDRRNFGEDAIDEFARHLEPLVSLAEQYGAILSIEPYLKCVIGSADAFLKLKARLPSRSLRANLDPTSLYRFEDLIDPASLVADLCDKLGPHAGLVHIKEVALADGFLLHAGLAPLGSGPTDWADFLNRIAPHTPADSWVILEHVATPEEAKASVQLLRQVAESLGIKLT